MPRKDVPRKARMEITISGSDGSSTKYVVRPLGRPDTLRAFQLASPEHTYHVCELADGRGAECDCPNHVFRKEHLDPFGCKHIKILRRFGMLPPVPEHLARAHREKIRGESPGIA